VTLTRVGIHQPEDYDAFIAEGGPSIQKYGELLGAPVAMQA
jgi:hypothetical protein